MVEMGMAEHDVGDVARPDPQLPEHAQRRDPVGDAELDAHRLAAALAHEAGVDEDDPVLAAGQHEGEGQVDDLLERGPVHQPGHALVLRPRELDDVDLPAGVAHGLLSSLRSRDPGSTARRR